MIIRLRPAVLLLALAALLALPAVASADDDPQMRKVGSCTGTSRIVLELEADDGRIDVELEVRTRSRTRAWRVVLVHERRVVFQRFVRPRSGRRTVKLEMTVPDWFGRNTLVARATGPGLETCRVTATL